MSILTTDIKVFGSASMPEDDTTTNIGGALSASKKVEFTDISPSGAVEMKSDSLSDTTQQLTITGRNPAGEIVSESQTLNGTTWVQFSTTFERILKMVLNSISIGDVSLREITSGEVLATMESGILQIRRPFYNAVAPAEGTKKFYEKVFFKNTHGTLTLTESIIAEAADPSTKVAFALETSLDGTDANGAENSRNVAPAGYTFNSSNKAVANNGNHSAGKGQGVWLELTLQSIDAATKTTYTLRETGITT